MARELSINKPSASQQMVKSHESTFIQAVKLGRMLNVRAISAEVEMILQPIRSVGLIVATVMRSRN